MGQFQARARAIGLTVAAAVAAFSGWARAADEAPDIFGTFWATEYHAGIQVLGGGELPLTQNGKAAYAKNMAGLKDGSIIDGPASTACQTGCRACSPRPTRSRSSRGRGPRSRS